MKFLDRIGLKNILKHEAIAPISVLPGDTLTLSSVDEMGEKHKVLEQDIAASMTITEAMIFKAALDTILRS